MFCLLRFLVRPFFVRGLKSSVLELPRKQGKKTKIPTTLLKSIPLLQICPIDLLIFLETIVTTRLFSEADKNFIIQSYLIGFGVILKSSDKTSIAS